MKILQGDGKVDAFYTADLIRACNLNPTQKTISEVGGTEEKGKKTLTKAEVFPMYKACKESKDQVAIKKPSTLSKSIQEAPCDCKKIQ